MTQTFSLKACQRIAEVLGEDTPRTHWKWGQWHHGTYNTFYEYRLFSGESHPNDFAVPAFTLSDLDASVWKALGEKLGWKNKNSIIWGVEPDWWSHAFHCYEAFLEGGMEAADTYLYSIIR